MEHVALRMKYVFSAGGDVSCHGKRRPTKKTIMIHPTSDGIFAERTKYPCKGAHDSPRIGWQAKSEAMTTM